MFLTPPPTIYWKSTRHASGENSFRRAFLPCLLFKSQCRIHVLVWSIWRFPEIGVALVIIHFSGCFSLNKTIYFGYFYGWVNLHINRLGSTTSGLHWCFSCVCFQIMWNPHSRFTFDQGQLPQRIVQWTPPNFLPVASTRFSCRMGPPVDSVMIAWTVAKQKWLKIW